MGPKSNTRTIDSPGNLEFPKMFHLSDAFVHQFPLGALFLFRLRRWSDKYRKIAIDFHRRAQAGRYEKRQVGFTTSPFGGMYI